MIVDVDEPALAFKMHRASAWKRAAVAGVVAAIAVAVVFSGALGDDAQRSPQAARQVASPGVGVTAVATVTVVPASPTASLTIPADALIQTPDEAVAWAAALTRAPGSQAPHAPQLVKVDLLTLRDGIVAAQRATGDDPDAVLAAWDAATLDATVVWRVQLDGADFQALMCPHGVECRPAKTAIITFKASDGGVVNIRYGVPVPQP
jgi:hypothetical protein